MTAIWWIRRDLRLNDNLTLQAALAHASVVPLFIHDPYFNQVSARRRGFRHGRFGRRGISEPPLSQPSSTAF